MINNKYAKPIRWGIIGCGNVTEIKSGPAYKKVAGFELVAVMRRDVVKLKEYAKRHNINKYYEKAEDLINDDEIDAIYIATPPDSHLYYALKVSEAGKPCCIEKPLTPSYKDSLTIYESFQKNNVPLFVAYYRRSLPRFIQIQKWLQNNEIGEVRHISAHLSKPPNSIDLSGAYNWRTDAKIAQGGYFDDLACHALDLFTYFLGDIEKATGFSTNQQGLYTGKDAVSASWIHKTGVTGSGIWNFGCDAREDKVEIFGNKGKIQFSVFDEGPIILNTKGTVEELYIEHPENIQLYHVENMKRQLLDGDFKHPSTGENALHVSWVMDKILGVI